MAYFFAVRATAHWAKGQHDRAISDYDEAIRLDPKDAEFFAKRGDAYALKGEYDRAIADFDEAIKLDPKNAVAFRNRGNAYLDKGDYDRAIADLDEAIRLNPKDSIAFHNRGQAYFRKGDYDRAIADFDAMIKLDPKNAYFLQRRGSAYTMKGQHNRAIADFDEAIRLNPEDASFIASRGKAYENSGDYDHAIRDYDQATRLKPNFTWAINNRAKIIASKRRWEYFRGKLNTDAVLKEKAAVVTHLIIERCDAGVALAVDLREKFPRLGEDEVRQAYAEMAALLVILLDRLSLAPLGSSDRDTFMGALADGLTPALQHKGVESDSFRELLGKRHEEYSHCRIGNEENESPKGELGWEFGKNISTVLCGFKHPVVGVSLATFMLGALVEWKFLGELLPESPR
jgi:tetratricopeptide (TPR) repeat protein